MSKTPADKTIEEQTFEALEDALKMDLSDDVLGGSTMLRSMNWKTRFPVPPAS